MPTEALVPIQNITLGGSASSVTFTSIPNTFKDLLITGSHTTAVNGVLLAFRVNGVSSNSYYFTLVNRNGTGVEATGSGPTNRIRLSVQCQSSGTGPSTLTANLFDYATARPKNLNFEAYSAELGVSIGMGLCNFSSVVSSFTILCDSSSFNAGSSFQMWGVVG